MIPHAHRLACFCRDWVDKDFPTKKTKEAKKSRILSCSLLLASSEKVIAFAAYFVRMPFMRGGLQVKAQNQFVWRVAVLFTLIGAIRIP